MTSRLRRQELKTPPTEPQNSQVSMVSEYLESAETNENTNKAVIISIWN